MATKRKSIVDGGEGHRSPSKQQKLALNDIKNVKQQSFTKISNLYEGEKTVEGTKSAFLKPKDSTDLTKSTNSHVQCPVKKKIGKARKKVFSEQIKADKIKNEQKILVGENANNINNFPSICKESVIEKQGLLENSTIESGKKNFQKRKNKRERKVRKGKLFVKNSNSTGSQHTIITLRQSHGESKPREKIVKQSPSESQPKIKAVKFNETLTQTNALKSVNFSNNWKMLQEILSKEKKKPAFHHRKRLKEKRAAEKPEVSTEKVEQSPTIWFDDVDDILIETLKNADLKPVTSDGKSTVNPSDDRLVKPGSFEGVTKAVAIDCEMVGVGESGKDSVLARVSIVNHFGRCVYDKYVKPREPVTDYRTHVSGIRPEDLKKGEDFMGVQKEVSEIFKNRLLVGHAIENDLKVLFLDHPRKMIRDTSQYKPFRKLFSGRKPSLKKLSETVLRVKVQDGEHNSVQDAQAAMRLYTMYRQQWEKEVKLKHRPKFQPSKKEKKTS